MLLDELEPRQRTDIRRGHITQLGGVPVQVSEVLSNELTQHGSALNKRAQERPCGGKHPREVSKARLPHPGADVLDPKLGQDCHVRPVVGGAGTLGGIACDDAKAPHLRSLHLRDLRVREGTPDVRGVEMLGAANGIQEAYTR
eukprot:4623968-Alexandrium_andersonii.AAC.1